MEINISGICMEVKKKKIKNMYLSVKPPEGRVVISAPISMPNKSIKRFAEERIEWVIEQRKKFERQSQKKERRYISGESLYIWGRKYVLIVHEDGKRNSFMLYGESAILSIRGGSTTEQRGAFLREQYRSMLKEEVEKLLPKWEERTGLHCNSWRTKYMTTRWGTCNTVEKRLWFNVQLAEKPLECLEYVILHELAHTKVRGHGAAFVAIMDEYMPEWRNVKKRLNEGDGE